MRFIGFVRRSEVNFRSSMSDGLIFQFFSGLSMRERRRRRCSSLDTCRKIFTMRVPLSCRWRSNPAMERYLCLPDLFVFPRHQERPPPAGSPDARERSGLPRCGSSLKASSGLEALREYSCPTMSAAAELTLVFASCDGKQQQLLESSGGCSRAHSVAHGVFSSAFQSWQSALYKSASDSGLTRVTTRMPCTAELLASQNVGPRGEMTFNQGVDGSIPSGLTNSFASKISG